MSFFVTTLEAKTSTLTPQSRLVVALDNSGSTSGDVLKREIQLAKKFASVFANATCIAWNFEASQVRADFSGVYSTGGTSPHTFVDFMQKKKIGADLLLLITDGQINGIDQFRTKLGQLALECPIIVVLTVAQGAQDATIDSFAGVDMSIVEACLTASSNVAVLLQQGAASDARFFQGTGYFAQFVGADGDKPASQRLVAEMTKIDFDTIWKKTFTVATVAAPAITVGTALATSTATSTVSMTLSAAPTSLSPLSSLASTIMSYFAPAPLPLTAEIKAPEAKDVAVAAEGNDFSVTMQQLPNDVVQMADGRYLVLGALIDYCSMADSNSIDAEQQKTLAVALAEAAKRTSLPKLNVDKMRTAIHALRANIDRFRNVDKIDAVKQRIYALQMEIALAENDETQAEKTARLRQDVIAQRGELIALNAQREQREILPELREAINALALIVQQYAENKGAFEYGSNRATAAHTIEDKELQEVGRCIRGACPIMLDDDDLCIYFQAPEVAFALADKEKKALPVPLLVDSDGESSQEEEKAVPAATMARPVAGQGKITFEQERAVACYFTRNQMVDNTALCGVAMLECLTPGVFGLEFARSGSVVASPLTQMPILGFLPLSFDMRVLIRHLSKILCGGKEMPFILRAYVSMVAQHLANNKWAQKQLRGHAQYVLNTLKLQCRFVREARIAALAAQGKDKKAAEKEAAAQETTLSQSIQHQLANPACLRLLAHGQVMAMIDIAQQLMPDFKFDVARARGVANFCNTLRMVRANYIALDRADKDPQCVVLECFRPDGTLRNTLHGHLAWFFASTHRRVGHELRLLRFQECVDRVLEDATFGAYFMSVYSGTEPPTALPPLVPTVEEPSTDNVHFDSIKSLVLYKRLLQQGDTYDSASEICCAYCDTRFETRRELSQHVKRALGPHFIEFTRILMHKRNLFESGSAAVAEQAIMAYLQRRCGVWNMAIYTQRTRREIRAMIEAVFEKK